MKCFFTDTDNPPHEYQGILKDGDACIICLRFPKRLTDEEILKKQFEKKVQSGLRKCPGHKYEVSYDNQGKCPKCGGYK